MKAVVITIEHAATECRKAADAFERVVHELPADPGPEVLDVFRAAERAFRHVREEVLPQLDAVVDHDNDPHLQRKVHDLWSTVLSHGPNETRSAVRAQFGAYADLPKAREVTGAMSDLMDGMFCGVELPELAANLRHVAAYLRTKHPLNFKEAAPSAVQIGDVIVGPKYNATIKDSNVGAVSIGHNAVATGNVRVNVAAGALTQEEHRASIQSMQAALVQDQDALDRLDARLFEALGQFLRLAREIQVGVGNLAETQTKMKATLDEVWAQHAAKGLRSTGLPKTLEIAAAIAKHPAMTEVVKKLLSE